MAKKQPSLDLDQVEPVRSFYRPHKRVQFMNELTNPITGEITRPESRTKQSFVPECDINNIIKSFKLTGQIKHINERAAQGTYADLPDSVDFQEALHLVKDARASFATLPSQVRDRFQNDPSLFLAFMGDPRNQDEIIKLGLAKDTRPPTTKSPVSSSTGDLKIED